MVQTLLLLLRFELHLIQLVLQLVAVDLVQIDTDLDLVLLEDLLPLLVALVAM